MNMLRMPLVRRGRDDSDTRRGERTARVLQLVERFVYDVGLLIAGDAVDLSSYVDAVAATRLRDAVQPALIAGAVTRPDFGEYAQVRIEGDLLDLCASVRAVVEFEDRSTRLDEHGAVFARPRRQVRLRLLLDPAVSRVLDHRIDFA